MSCPAFPLSREVDQLAGRLAAAYAAYGNVRAVALGGSRHSALGNDAQSDVDLYVYRVGELRIADRESIAASAGTETEVGNTFWEDGDEWLAGDPPLRVDVTFRHVGWIADEVERVLGRYQPRLGYSTALLYSVQNCVILQDQTGWLEKLRARACEAYPLILRDAIVAKNHPILRRAHSAYLGQIAVAAARDDLVSVNHRVAALLASYFDIVIAVNLKAHPGEKRLVRFVRECCPSSPPRLGDDVAAVLAAASSGRGAVVPRVTKLLDRLDSWLLELGLLPPWPRSAPVD